MYDTSSNSSYNNNKQQKQKKENKDKDNDEKIDENDINSIQNNENKGGLTDDLIEQIRGLCCPGDIVPIANGDPMRGIYSTFLRSQDQLFFWYFGCFLLRGFFQTYLFVWDACTFFVFA